MPKVHPRAGLVTSSPSSSTPSPYVNSGREAFTIWMKSLVLNGNGCTVFNANGDMVYRMDNYDCKHSQKVYLMDYRGTTLSTITKKKLRLFGCWEGYKSTFEKERPWFQVKKTCRILNAKSSCEVTLRCDTKEPVFYHIQRFTSKSAYKIVDEADQLIAEVHEKHTSSGVALGSDVLTLVVEPNIDQSLIMGIVIAYSLMSHKM